MSQQSRTSSRVLGPRLPPRPSTQARTLPPPIDTDIPVQPSVATTPSLNPPSSPRVVTFVESPVSVAKKTSSRRPPSRIIRTFEEIEVPKMVMAEEWYEELECGICSNILGAPQALVPCGHTFCGSCAWQWIRKGKNNTCPHCRVEVIDATPLVPNIVVDQIIERKLKLLPKGEHRDELVSERAEKAESWKIIQASLPKPVQKRSRNLENVFGMFDPAPETEAHRRRASRHYMELGAPIVPQARHSLANSGINLGDLRRMEAHEQAVNARLDGRRIREAIIRQNELGAMLEEGNLNPVEDIDRMAAFIRERRTRSSAGSGEARHPTETAPPQRGSVVSVEAAIRRPSEWFSRFPSHSSDSASRNETSSSVTLPNQARQAPARLGILASRQARGRSGGGGGASGSREVPLVILSDSE